MLPHSYACVAIKRAQPSPSAFQSRLFVTCLFNEEPRHLGTQVTTSNTAIESCSPTHTTQKVLSCLCRWGELNPRLTVLRLTFYVHSLWQRILHVCKVHTCIHDGILSVCHVCGVLV